MQPIHTLRQWLLEHADEKHFLFTLQDLRPLFNTLTENAFKTLMSRAVKLRLLIRICRGVYLYQKAIPTDGLLLYHVAATLRAGEFNYISLETVLSDAGVISQIPFNWISIMSSGRSSTLACGTFGTIEFIHTNQKPENLINALIYDKQRGMWRASVAQAIRDMKATHRNCDLINWDIANEFI